MKKTKYIVKPTSQFKKDYKLAMKRHLDISLLEEVVSQLALGKALPDKNQMCIRDRKKRPPVRPRKKNDL